MEQQRLFSNQRLIRLIIPLVIEQGLTILVGMCDGVMVSSVGEAAISGVSLVDMINAVVLILFAALATGGAVVTSQFLGARQMEKAKKSAGQLVLMAGVLGSVSAVLCIVFANGLMKLFFGSIDQAVMDAGLIYLRITALSFPFIALYNAGAAMFRSTGNSKVSMQVSLLMNLINVLGNAFCIFVLKMGVAGVAIPTLVSRAVAAAVILAMAAQKKHELHLQRQWLTHIDRDMMGSILRIGIPSACENSIFQLGRLVVVSMIALFGTTQTSANAVANTLDGVGIIVGQAMGLAMVTVVGQSVGAGDLKQTSYYIKKLMLWTYVLMGISNGLLFLFVDQMVGLYSSLTPETVVLARTLVQIHSGFAILLWPVSFVLPNALRAANDVKFTMWVGVGSMILFRVVVSWFLCVQFQMGAIGVWIAMILDWVCRISFFLPRIFSGKWQTKYTAG
ncbi:MAG TPA: MATE family efflux transporter [Candidatus Faecousia intestinavium]|nr:MATE family efflux transporter [Candidatus Faecousia intestinavium]